MGEKRPGSGTVFSVRGLLLIAAAQQSGSHQIQSNQSADNQAKMALLSGGNKQWATVAIPHNYIGSSWPIRFTAMDDGCEGIAVAGRTGFAHYTISNRYDSNFILQS